MKDIDFDELDKAVNSLMAGTDKPVGVSKEEQPAPAESEPTSSVDAVDALPAEAVSTDPIVVTPAVEAAAIPVRQSPPAVKRSGRFMDMVSKPTDTKRASSQPTPSREGLSITPRQNPVAESVVEPLTPQANEPVATPDIMPDPIDTAVDIEAEVAPATGTPASSESAATGSSPIESPFIVDAKVEKRPLNPGLQDEASSLDSQSVTPEPDAEPVSTESNVVSTENESDEPPLAPQVPELNSDLVAIESDEHVAATQAVDTKDAASDVTEPSVPLGASSIAQQYTTQPSSGDQSHAAIYDASQYPEPVSHPAKGKSSWLWVLWVVLLLGIGAGGAIVLYNLGIIP